jgi:rubrerythrin
MDINIQSAILEALATNEETLSVLYNKYSLQFVAYRKFWSNLSAKEISHANIIRGFYAKIRDGQAYFEHDRFNLKAINYFTNYLNDAIRQSEQKDMLNALSIALDIERSLIERKFFTVLKADSKLLKSLLKRLADDTKQHRLLIEKELSKLKAILL